MHPLIKNLITCIDLEEKEQADRYRLDQQHTLRSLKSEGLALHPIVVTRKSFGYADFPEVSFRLPHPADTGAFRDGVAIECFMQGEEPVKGILLQMDSRSGEFRLFAPDHPDWLEDDGVGIKLAPDSRTSSIMKKSMELVWEKKERLQLFRQLHGEIPIPQTGVAGTPPPLSNSNLNASQRDAVSAILDNTSICVVHGPPGTGKTTTLVEAIIQLVKKGEKVLVSAPSNTAVDHISKALLRRKVSLLRVGNTSKVDEAVFLHTPEGRMQNSKELKEIRALSKRADEFRRMAHKYKRHFGKAEREQRNLLFKEVRSIHDEIKKLQLYNEERMYSQADVITGTPIGLHDAGLFKMEFHTLVIDEAGQCLEPLAWCIMPLANKMVLAGDHWQLPPTVLSQKAAQQGLNRSILELAIGSVSGIHLLNVQYRMRKVIAGFSSNYFYNNLLDTAEHLQDTGVHLTFIDTAGTGFGEEQGADGSSLQNRGELLVVQKLLEEEQLELSNTAFISPYAGQVAAAKEQLPGLRISTIDSFQGQEMENIMLSLVRSNEDGVLGFLKDYRRMNVAITRAKERLYIIGDSATLATDPFFEQLLAYIEQYGRYGTAWEYDLS